ncbi:hypothetical protein Belba_2579 [Belliella baltica DSM 15883]|uniref:DUF4468 domain-containing protein n=1 Tax=Belliella baltica (strain DSM 15883 / CIP 108006 / LMG 21964 / BA134) TaxID=866536 RepID=I3Z7B0_BELBD|nr:hypothetical protein [Belliella baltica]AFL85128.1 hypothetical protein Belba_2579 [Belliella baltica DSM 15883]
MSKKFKLFLLFFLLITSSITYAQKREVEKSVKAADVPEEARLWLKDAYEGKSRVKWYFQTDGEKEVYEAKLKWKKKWHSVEFLPSGEILNIEILITIKELPEDVYENMVQYFTANYQRYKIDRIQIQYTGESDDLEDLIDENEVAEQLILQYEVEYFGREKGENKMWEGHFDRLGKMLKKRVIELNSTDILDF